MQRLIRKDRTISLRLSEHEFEGLKALYVAHGARSISDFVRSAMNRIISENSRGSVPLEAKVREMDGKLRILDGEVARLTRLLECRHDENI